MSFLCCCSDDNTWQFALTLFDNQIGIQIGKIERGEDGAPQDPKILQMLLCTERVGRQLFRQVKELDDKKHIPTPQQLGFMNALLAINQFTINNKIKCNALVDICTFVEGYPKLVRDSFELTADAVNTRRDAFPGLSI